MTHLHRLFITAILLSGAGAGLAFSLRRNPDHLAVPLETISEEIRGWKQVATQPIGPNALKRLLPTEYVSRTYRRDGKDLGLFIAFYAQQRAGESMHSPKHCLPGTGWEIWKYDSTKVPTSHGPVLVNKYFVQNAGKRVIVYYWYQSRQRIIASEYLGKLMLIRDAVVDGRTAGTLVRIVVNEEMGAEERAVEFAAGLIPQLEQCFRP